MLPPDCSSYRERALEACDGGPADGRHGADCAACRAWAERLRVQRGLLSSMERLLAPEELSDRVSEELRGFPLRFAAACEEIGSLRAPAELDELVARRIEHHARVSERAAQDLWAADAEPGSSSLALRALGSLEPLRAPSVLDRLVAEEIEGGARVEVERSVGELERLRAPSLLNRRVMGPFADPSLGDRRVTRFAVGLAAAGLLWIAGAATHWFGLVGADHGVTSTELVAVADPLEGFAERLAADPLPERGGSPDGSRPFTVVDSVDQIDLHPFLATLAGAELAPPVIELDRPPAHLFELGPTRDGESESGEPRSERGLDSRQGDVRVREQEERRG